MMGVDPLLESGYPTGSHSSPLGSILLDFGDDFLLVLGGEVGVVDFYSTVRGTAVYR